jgi:hypothetical protein
MFAASMESNIVHCSMKTKFIVRMRVIRQADNRGAHQKMAPKHNIMLALFTALVRLQRVFPVFSPTQDVKQ